MRQILNTLYVMMPNAYVRLEGDTLHVEVEREKKLQVPLHHIGSLVCFGDVLISSAVLHRCAEDGRGVVLLDRNGQFKVRLEGPVSGNILLRQAQYRAADSAATALEIARSVVAGKLHNCRQVVLRGARESDDEQDAASLSRAADELAHAIKRLPRVSDLDTLRGVEGESARLYFSALPLLVRHDARAAFTMNGRSRRPPRDRFNALLSFLYTLLVHDCRSAAESVGLDSQLGFLHAVRPGRPALALDLMEEFRPLLADRVALTLINRCQITERDFQERPGGAVYLTDEPRRTVVTAYQQRKQDELTHPLLEQQVPLGLLPQLQARLLARVLRGDMEGYLPFVVR